MIITLACNGWRCVEREASINKLLIRQRPGGFNPRLHAQNAHALKTNEIAARLANGATKAIRFTKISANIPLRRLAAELMDASLPYEALTNVTQDHQEAVNAFNEKRPANFTGS